MRASSFPARRSIAAAAITALSACGTVGPGGDAGPAAPAPSYRVGDRWTYRVEQGFRLPVVWDETHEVVAAGGDGVTVRVTLKGEQVDVVRTERWSAPGVVHEGAIFEGETDRFDPPMVRFKFPLQPGDRWSQRMRDMNKPATPYGDIQRHVTVGGYEKVTTPAATYDALRLRVIQRLDDETVWRNATECSYLLWYAPAVGATVREEKDCQYTEKGGGYDSVAYIRSQHARVVLTASTRAGP